MNSCVVNSHNHWDKLEEVIVGTPYHLDYHDDITFRLFFYQNIRMRALGKNVLPTNIIRDESREDLEGFVELLEKEHIVVKRPQELNEARVTKSPWWEAPLSHAFMSRDLFVVIGNEIIETAPMIRARYFEGDMYKELFTEYFKQGAKWVVAPKSRLLDKNFDFSYARKYGYIGDEPNDSFYEIMFDGAQTLRFGRDIFMNCSTENHRMGLQWLARHLGDEYRVHELNVTDNHIDGRILPLRPGVLLVNRKVREEMLPQQFKKWDIIWYDPKELSEDKEENIMLASTSIGMNVLSLDEKKIVVQDTQKALIRSLEKHGFIPIPCRWRHGRVFGGGFHCMTLDIRRQSKLETYFD